MTGELPSDLRIRARELADRAADAAVERLAGAEFATWSCAAQLPPDLKDRPAPIVDGFRRECRAALRARLAAAWPRRRELPEQGDVTVETAPQGGDAKLRITPVFVAGRYRKTARGISQTVFHCRVCRGARSRKDDCPSCGGSGRLFEESVEGFVCPPLRAAFGGRSASFHGSGREDVDVRMLGDGRPFGVTIERPRVRVGDLAAIEREIAERSAGRVTVAGLAFVDRKAVKRLTSEHGEKAYRAWVRRTGDDPWPADAVARVVALAGAVLAQRTPSRVVERRADLVRERRVLDVRATFDGDDLVVDLRTEAGTYVKEFISGDDGRTTPSVAEALGIGVVCAQLDVTGVALPESRMPS